MFPFTKRQFLRAAGLTVAGRLLPRRLSGAGRNETARKLIIVTFGGGVRYAETFTREGLRNVPRLAELQPKGHFFRTCLNSGVLSHYNSTASIVTGNWQRVDDFGFDRPASPTLFEYFRKGAGAGSQDAWAICTNKSFASIGASGQREFGSPLGANVILPKQLLIEAVNEIIRKKPRQGVADRDNVLEQLQGILN